MKKFFSLAFALFAALAAVTSCSDDDDNVSSFKPQRDYDLNPKLITPKGEGLHKRGLEGQIPEEYADLEAMLDLQFYQYVFEYTSVGPDLKTPVRLTGVLSMNPAVYNHEVAPTDIILYNEYTTAKHGERTSQDAIDDISMFTSKLHNCIAVAADLYGWTLTEDKPQTYCCTHITAQETMDCWDAAIEILKQLDFDIKGLPIFNVGYSAGALEAIAVQRYVDEKRPDIKFNATMVGGGPYDLEAIYKDYIETDTTGYVCALPLMLVAYKETFGMSFSYSDVFQKPLCDSIQSWILSKDYNTWEINGMIGPEKHISELLTPEACDTTSALARGIIDKFRENSVCGPSHNWQPNKDTQYYVYHTAGDLYIPQKVGIEMADYLESKGCKVIRKFADNGNHVTNGLFYFVAESQFLMAGVDIKLPDNIGFDY